MRVFTNVMRKVLPPLTYCRTVNLLRPLLHTQKIGVRLRFGQEGDLLTVSWKDQKLYFASPSRASRYVIEGGPQAILDKLRCKYQHGPVYVEQGDLVFEVGANIGEFALSIAETAREVHSYEPDPHPHGALLMNLSRYPHCHAYALALADRMGTLMFYLSTDNANSSAITPSHFDRKVEIEATTLDAVCEAKGINAIDFLKVEAEGFEPEVLKGARVALRITKKVAVDCNPERMGYPTIDQCRKILEEEGFALMNRNYLLFGYRGV